MIGQFDETDKKILRRLGENARVPFSTLANELGISNTMVHQRVNKLRQSGVIKNATYVFEPKVLGYTTEAMTRIQVTNAKYVNSLIAALKEIPEIVECSNITGKYALIIKIFAKDNSHLRDVLYSRIHPLAGVEGTDTTISFETAFQKNIAIE
ncbi:Lrp/AsnC family transcriptional regulator, regulator for asnA, asnC and gidA [Reichenbachiella faecimaris]|uniref:Lrp/AsnC family transcriptional regulator, regulator for asnA, asnC and gidA n=1 Tax=Reichenbachiella faecimaris TaxID=692418 RepID=A0A1W2G9W7_REIFA|nr:Lrp/AsnC family transcriptional regulator [Reichenbachiella faecimaris]SMD33096.1 Lrp/AsnC family transcriptional regulator, regulator for asnA, asnC and gidA [Reichenbachiella faecimaris]